MRFRISSHRFLLTSLATLVALTAVTSSASAAVTVGQNCATPGSGPPVMFQAATSPGASYAMPTDGVLTKWGINRTGTSGATVNAAAIGSFQGGQWTIVNGTPFQVPADDAVSEYATRISVSAGQTLGLLAINSIGVMCSGYVGPSGDLIDYSGSYLPIGSSFAPSGQIPAYRVSIFGTLEPDVDKDGYGDETQDACPQSATFQTACPVLSISQKLSASRSAINVLAAASVDTTLTADASVKLPKIGRKKARTVKFKSKATALTAGNLKAIKLKLPSSVRKAVKVGKKLKVTVTLTGNGLANTATTKSTIRLKR